jgi:hypothetical protein
MLPTGGQQARGGGAVLAGERKQVRKIIVAVLGAGALALLPACGGTGPGASASMPAAPRAGHRDGRTLSADDAPSPPPGHDAEWVVAWGGAYDLYRGGGGPQGRPVGQWCRGYVGGAPDTGLLRQLIAACEAGIKAAGGP